MLDVMDEARVRAGEAHAAWSERFNEMFALVAGEFENAGSRKRARAYVLGLLSHAERKNGWTLAEFAWSGGLGESHPQAPTERSVSLSVHSALLIAIRPARASRPSERIAGVPFRSPQTTTV